MDDALGILVLPARLEEFELRAHARSLLEIPRVVALEPGRVRTPRFMRDAATVRQARRLKFPGRPRAVVLYHPAQYPLVRGLLAHYEELELWYVPPDRTPLAADGGADAGELTAFDGLARERAAGVLAVEGTRVEEEPLRARLRELEVITPYAFIPDASRRRSGRPR